MKAAATTSEKPAENIKEAQDLAAYNGEQLPPDVLFHQNYFIIRGIRHHEAFAKSPAVTKFCSEKRWAPEYARARHARLIMSNTIPEITSEIEKPYCIWYPDLATEDTYRSLAQRYPDMRYHVGRACAVAGYKVLYDELDLLPDVSIAEEARDNGHMDIFDTIVSQPVRYAIMNDYMRTVNLENPVPGACLNGDTAVRSSLERAKPRKNAKLTATENHYFDIQEDDYASPFSWPTSECSTLEARFTELVYMPLPRDLPALNKDVLILLAAWNGNVERYSRLRRPVLIPNELTAVLRGVYHHTPFARWLSTCVDDIVRPGTTHSDLVWQAIHARSIMNGDLSRIDHETDGATLPSLFWWPHHPHETTLRELVWRRPDLKHQVTLACIASSYQEFYNELTAGTEPTQQQLEMAVQVMDSHYREDVCQRAKEHGVELIDPTGHAFHYEPWPYPTSWSRSYLRPNKEMWRDEHIPLMPKELFNEPDHHSYDWEEWGSPFGDPLSLDMNVQMGEWMCFISATEGARRAAAKEARGPRNRWYLYFSTEDKERRLKPGPEPSRPKNFEDEEYFP
ncbi:hypothetical protein CGCF415_v007626 [Colletotrichum fructicola]|nr:hypothetical protein CGCF415_v007626 [Colletotrichum fructicola]KAF4936135.1 hypothetical protein CGCF245_v006991 [Colletotrichum fructicola]